jgi:hypothetical protein
MKGIIAKKSFVSSFHSCVLSESGVLYTFGKSFVLFNALLMSQDEETMVNLAIAQKKLNLVPKLCLSVFRSPIFVVMIL